MTFIPKIAAKFCLMGTLIEAPKLSATTLMPICDAKFQVNRKTRKGDVTEIYPIAFFGETATNVCQMPVGSFVIVEGILQRKERTSQAGMIYANTDMIGTKCDVLSQVTPNTLKDPYAGPPSAAELPFGTATAPRPQQPNTYASGRTSSFDEIPF